MTTSAGSPAHVPPDVDTAGTLHGSSMRSSEPSATATEGGSGHSPMGTVRRRFSRRISSYRQVAGWGIFGGALAYCLLVFGGAIPYVGTSTDGIVMGDAAAYYFVDTPYDWTDQPAGAGEYRYSPAFLWVIAPFRLLPWEVFAALWFAAHLAVLLYLRLPWMLAFPGVLDDAVRGNINTFLALAVVLIVRRGAAPLWGAVLLTKVTPGVAVMWHLARREYRAFAAALVLTAAVVGSGFVFDPRLWSQWFESLVTGPETYAATVALAVPLPLRIVFAAAITFFAATSGRAWLLPVAMIAAMPGIWPSAFALLVASVALYRSRDRHIGAAPSGAAGDSETSGRSSPEP